MTLTTLGRMVLLLATVAVLGCVQVAPKSDAPAGSAPRTLTEDERARLQADNARLAGELDRLRRENEALEQQKRLLEQELKLRKDH